MSDPTRVDVDQLLREAEALMASIENEFGADLEEERRERLAARVQALQAGRKKLADLAGGSEPAADSRPSSGIHEAIDDLLKAIQETTRLLT